MKKLLSLIAIIVIAQSVFPCMTFMMSLDDTAIKTLKPTSGRNYSTSSEPSSPADPASLMPHSSAAVLLRAYTAQKMHAALRKSQNSKDSNAA